MLSEPKSDAIDEVLDSLIASPVVRRGPLSVYAPILEAKKQKILEVYSRGTSPETIAKKLSELSPPILVSSHVIRKFIKANGGKRKTRAKTSIVSSPSKGAKKTPKVAQFVTTELEVRKPLKPAEAPTAKSPVGAVTRFNRNNGKS